MSTSLLSHGGGDDLSCGPSKCPMSLSLRSWAQITRHVGTGDLWVPVETKSYEYNRLLSSDATRTAQKTTLPTNIRCRENVFTELLPGNDRGIHRHTRPTICILLCVFVAAGMFTEPLPSNDREIHRQTHRHTRPTSFILLCIRCRGNVFTEPLPSTERRGTLNQAVA
jgi:hypothetical protein